MVKTLFLFDIDGTLVVTGGAGERALRLALQDRFAVDDSLSGIEIAGRTDSSIARAILAKHGLPITDENLALFYDSYLRHLEALLPELKGRVLPGVVDLLTALHQRSDVVLGLLTGNLERGANLKLEHYGIRHFFAFGAFADDHTDRDQLGSFARARAEKLHGTAFPPERIFILGDTPHDVACARAIGARAVAIATGALEYDELASCAPDFLFEDLSDTAQVLETLLPRQP